MRIKSIVVIAAIIAICIPVNTINAQPPLPHAFYGSILINGSSAPTGTVIEAQGEGVITGITGNPLVTTAIGEYGSESGIEQKLVVQGDIVEGTAIHFYVNGVEANQIAEWHTSEITELELTVTMPAVNTIPATDITYTGATLNGDLLYLGSELSMDVSFQLGTSPGVYTIETASQEMSSTGTFSSSMGGLLLDTTYYFRAKATNSTTVYGEELSFTTITSWMHIGLGTGWNTFSVPVSLHPDNNAWGEFLTNNSELDCELAYYFEDGIYKLVGEYYNLVPCDAMYVKMAAEGIATIVSNPGISLPPFRYLVPGWNLVGLAALENMNIADALVSIYHVTGDLTGYSQVVSPPTNQPYWVFIRDKASADLMIVGKGYWVFMINGGTLAGFTFTPL